ncbi:peptide chain release factor 1 [Candidatus Woesearchaeota archaeon CG10_big_fil_rev_8_21_14_0_10_34_8]|nr:MAG: peptide chain release factor 1 [Candidatus Woesearchaeota archaeon CG10_big_fil_rev_8_21_14_0_10_34_8]
MTLTSVQRHQLKKFIKDLEVHRGRHTELVTVYVPSDYDLNKVIQQLADEQGTASNIKSSSTRKNVQGALERMIQHLRLFKKTPPNGLASFSGNVAEREGQTDLKVWSMEPPEPLNVRIYRCDKAFILEPLIEMCDIKEVYGLIVMDRRDANLALLKGKKIIPLQKTHSEVPGKFRAGGQSAQRFARLREGAAKEHYKKVADYAKEQFFPLLKNLKGILVGGPGPTKYDFVNYITADVKNKIIAIKDLSYTDEFGLQELVDKSQDVLAKEELAEEKKVMQRFFELLSTKEKMVSYGEQHVLDLLKRGVVDTLLLSEALDDKTIEDFEAEAEKLGSTVAIISLDTREGVQLKEMGCVAAILRYEVE